MRDPNVPLPPYAIFANRFRIDDYLRLGWLPTSALQYCEGHGEYSILCLWLCNCPIKVPLRRQK